MRNRADQSWLLARGGVQRLSRWLERAISFDRLLAIVSIASTFILGALGIVASLSTSLFWPFFTAVLILVPIGTASLLAIYRSRTNRHGRPQSLSYELSECNIRVEILDDDGRLATIRHHEKVVPLTDHFVAIRRAYWGDWDDLQLGDLKCVEPANAFVSDLYTIDYEDGQLFLISLRHTFSAREAFDLTVELSVKNGFGGENGEFYGWTIIPEVGRLAMEIVFPRGRFVIPESLRVKQGPRGREGYQDLSPDHLKFLQDGRQHLTWVNPDPTQGWNYALIWRWRRNTPIEGELRVVRDPLASTGS